MKRLYFKRTVFILALISAVTFASCSKDENPEPKNKTDEITGNEINAKIVGEWLAYEEVTGATGAPGIFCEETYNRKTDKPYCKLEISETEIQIREKTNVKGGVPVWRGGITYDTSTSGFIKIVCINGTDTYTFKMYEKNGDLWMEIENKAPFRGSDSVVVQGGWTIYRKVVK